MQKVRPALPECLLEPDILMCPLHTLLSEDPDVTLKMCTISDDMCLNDSEFYTRKSKISAKWVESMEMVCLAA